jgi:hypothetical protein
MGVVASGPERNRRPRECSDRYHLAMTPVTIGPPDRLTARPTDRLSPMRCFPVRQRPVQLCAGSFELLTQRSRLERTFLG